MTPVFIAPGGVILIFIFATLVMFVLILIKAYKSTRPEEKKSRRIKKKK
jgi:hypothetical protein